MSASSMGLGTAGKRAHTGKLAGTGVFDPTGDQVGKIHDAVVTFRVGGTGSVIGFVVEVGLRKRVLLPSARAILIEAGSVITTGLLNMRSFTQRPVKAFVFAELFDQVVTLDDGLGEARILDVAMERHHPKDWVILKLHVQRQHITAPGLMRLGKTLNVRASEVSELLKVNMNQAVISPIAQTEDMRPADLVDHLHDLPIKCQVTTAQQLSDARPADVFERLGDDDRVVIVSGLEANRAADVLDVMQPDDAADPVSEPPEAQARALLSLIEPEEAEDVRRLLSYAESTAGSLMVTGPMIFGPDTTVVQMLASVRREDLPASLATVALITRPPEKTPTGPYLEMVHIQHALREPPQTLLGTIFDFDIETVLPQVHIATATRLLVIYNLTVPPVIDKDFYLLGVVSVDDLPDEPLPEDWRNCDDEVTDRIMARSIDG